MLEINKSRIPAPIIAEQVKPETRGRRTVLLFMRLVAIYLVFQSIQCWMRVLGLADDAPNRFDTMTPEWQLLIAFLCVSQPVAALGMWAGHSWGIAVWVIPALVEIHVFTVYPEVFGYRYLTVAINGLLLAIFLFLEISMRFIPNKRLT